MIMEGSRRYLRNPPDEELMKHESDQRKGVAPPPLETAIPKDAHLVDLPAVDNLGLGDMPIAQAIRNRESRRAFADAAVSLDELSFLLWATQGIRRVHPDGVWSMRTVPSGGARHPYETYLIVRRISGVEPGLYRYSALQHKLVELWTVRPQGVVDIAKACYDQQSARDAAVTFVWTAVPYRTEWRYGPDSLKDILLTGGHICQNLYLACEAIGLGTCAIVAYNQDLLDRLIGVDGHDEISIYVAPVGRPAESE